MKTFTANLFTFLATLFFLSVSHAQESGQQPNLTENDRLQIAVQKICPVSGGELGSMGEPIKVKVGEQIAYLCCKGCQGKKLNAKLWTAIQHRIAAAQGI